MTPPGLVAEKKPEQSLGRGTEINLNTASAPAADAYDKRMDEHRLTLPEIYARLASGADGLGEAEARRRLARHGYNDLTARPGPAAVVKFLRQFRNLFAGLLLVGAVLAFAAEQMAPGQDQLFVAVALLAVVFLNAVFTYVQEHESEKIMESFRKMLPAMMTVLRDGQPRRVETRRIVPGDVIFLAEGDRVPADARLIEVNQLKIDLSSLTGESEPQLRTLDRTHDNILESRNMAFSGTLIQCGDGKAIVYGTGMDTQIGRIVQLTHATGEAETPLRREIRRFVRLISLIAVILGAVFFAAGLLRGQDLIGSLLFAIGIIVANVPEGLLPTVTLALSMASRRMARRNALVKNLESIEALGATTVICTDKTGTITQNRMSVHTVVLGEQEHPAHDARVFEPLAAELAMQVMGLCNNAQRVGTGYGGDPTDIALRRYVDHLRHDDGRSPLAGASREHEIPFDSANRRMTVRCRLPDGTTRTYMKGAPEQMLAVCATLLRGGTRVAMTRRWRQRLLGVCDRLARRGERVLALACREGATADDATDFVFVGMVGMLDPPHPEVRDAVAMCRRAGIRVLMITGDHGITAEAVARQVGLLHGPGRVVRGDELEAMSDEALAEVLRQRELVFARTSPLQKLRIVRNLQRGGEVVTVTGDGVNDAPALKHADMGVAMGKAGTDVAKESSRMALLDDNFATIVAAVEEGRRIFDNLRKFIGYVLSHTTPEILPFIATLLFGIPLPLTVVLILCIDLGTDVLPALGLGVEPAERDVMARPPRPRGERLLTHRMLFDSYVVSGLFLSAAAFAVFFLTLTLGGWHWGEAPAVTDPLYRQAVTAYFVTIVIGQAANVLNRRSRHESLLAIGPFSNRLIGLGIATSLAMAALIVHVPALNRLLGTAPIDPWQWGLALLFALLMIAGVEIGKLRIRGSG